MTNASSREIYLGGPIANGSERTMLWAVVDHLAGLGVDAVILANVFLSGRQIDLIVATAFGASVVEVKASRFAVRGELNGPWTRRHADGTWRPYRNAYQQALDAKFAVRDALTAWDPSAATYPSGAAVFVPTFPAGAELTSGDNKAKVEDLSRFLLGLPTSGQRRTPLSAWRAFAAHLRLELVDLGHRLLADDEVAAEIARSYQMAFAHQYGPTAQSWIPEDETQLAGLLNAAASSGVHLNGPSGCGKSLMAHRLAIDLSGRGHPVIFIAGKDVADSWRDTVRREIGLLVDDGSDEVLRSLRKARLPLVLVVDGLNEIQGDRADAIRGVLAMARRHDAILVVSDQLEPGLAFAGLTSVFVPPPSLSLKRRIATNGSPPSDAVVNALAAVSSGLEASLIGKVRQALPVGATRLQLLERYARERLGEHARMGTFGLRRLASRLHEDVAYSLRETAFDEFMVAQGLDSADADALLASGLLARRADRVSFGHEMFLAAFAAFDLANIAISQPSYVGSLLSTPRHRRMAAEVVSAIDDAEVVHAVLETTTNAVVLAGAVEGELGPSAEVAAAALLREAADACIEEIASARIELNPTGRYPRADWAEAGLKAWSPQEDARLQAIGETAAGASFDLYMELCSQMDAKLDSERQRLRQEAQTLEIGMRSEGFALVYYNFGRSLGFSNLRHTRGSASSARHRRRVAVKDLETFTSGQLHFALESRYALFDPVDAEALADFFILAFEQRYRFEPYHVRLALLGAAGFLRDIGPETRERLIAAIQALEVNQNWALNSAIIDALKFLGALDDEAEDQRGAIRAEIEEALDDPETEARCGLALSVCVRSFDHPFDHIYNEEIGALETEALHTLFRRAVSAPDTYIGMANTWVIMRLIELGNPTDAQRLQRFANLPVRPNRLVQQEEWAAFVLVTRFMGRHRLQLPPMPPETPTDHCFMVLRSIIYAWEAKDDGLAQDAWRLLAEADIKVAMRCLAETERALSDRFAIDRSEAYPLVSIASRFPKECLSLSRAFLDAGLDKIIVHHLNERRSGLSYALQCVGQFGDRSDLPRVRTLARFEVFGEMALETLKSLDTRET